MSNEGIKRLTFKDIIAKKGLLDKNKKEFKEIYCPALEGNLLFKLPSDNEIIDIMEESEGSKIRATYENSKKLIYNNCGVLQNQELHEAFGIVDPFDIVPKLFTMGQIFNVFEKLTEHLDLEEFSDKVKN